MLNYQRVFENRPGIHWHNHHASAESGLQSVDKCSMCLLFVVVVLNRVLSDILLKFVRFIEVLFFGGLWPSVVGLADDAYEG